MNAIANYITIANLPHYVKCSSSRNIIPELNCYWSSNDRRSYPFIISITGNIATAVTFPYNRKEYRRTGRLFTFRRRYMNHLSGWHQLSYTFEILEKVATGEQFAIIYDVERGGLVF